MSLPMAGWSLQSPGNDLPGADLSGIGPVLAASSKHGHAGTSVAASGVRRFFHRVRPRAWQRVNSLGVTPYRVSTRAPHPHGFLSPAADGAPGRIQHPDPPTPVMAPAGWVQVRMNGRIRPGSTKNTTLVPVTIGPSPNRLLGWVLGGIDLTIPLTPPPRRAALRPLLVASQTGRSRRAGFHGPPGLLSAHRVVPTPHPERRLTGGRSSAPSARHPCTSTHPGPVRPDRPPGRSRGRAMLDLQYPGREARHLDAARSALPLQLHRCAAFQLGQGEAETRRRPANRESELGAPVHCRRWRLLPRLPTPVPPRLPRFQPAG